MVKTFIKCTTVSHAFGCDSVGNMQIMEQQIYVKGFLMSQSKNITAISIFTTTTTAITAAAAAAQKTGHFYEHFLEQR